MEETKPSAPLLYPKISTATLRITFFSEQYINDKILANKKFNNNITIIKYIRIYYEIETKNYTKKLNRYEKYINVDEITEILLSSIATIATSTCLMLSWV